MLLIYVPKISPRSRYTIKTVLTHFLSLQSFELTSDLDRFTEYIGPKLVYAKKAIGDEAFIYASGLLERRDIQEQNLEFSEYEGTPTLFPQKIKALLPFDLFSAVFFMLSRYEEYLPHIRDHYDRFTAQHSIAFKQTFIDQPIVDHWVLSFKEKLIALYPQLKFGKRQYRYLNTIDIDNAYAYKHKGLVRTTGSILKSIFKVNVKDLGTQLSVLFGKRQDPFDNYDYLRGIQKKHNLESTYFFLLADYGLNDKNLSHENRAFQSLIKSLADFASVGIHPSFGSNKFPERLRSEIKRLKSITNREIHRSRQHFLKLSLPETYRNLIENDIQEDYTMGFASVSGFRAGTCTPYPFYDLDEEVETKLMVFPFQVMEATYQYYQEKSMDQIKEEISSIIKKVKEVEGTFISLWHNESLSDEGEWKGWRHIYEHMIQNAVS